MMVNTRMVKVCVCVLCVCLVRGCCSVIAVDVFDGLERMLRPRRKAEEEITLASVRIQYLYALMKPSRVKPGASLRHSVAILTLFAVNGGIDCILFILSTPNGAHIFSNAHLMHVAMMESPRMCVCVCVCYVHLMTFKMSASHRPCKRAILSRQGVSMCLSMCCAVVSGFVVEVSVVCRSRVHGVRFI